MEASESRSLAIFLLSGMLQARTILHSNGFQLVRTSMEKLLPRLLMVGELLGQFIRWTLDSAEQNALINLYSNDASGGKKE